MILAGDIGGTKVNLAFFGEGLRLAPENLASYPSRDYSTLEEIVRKFLSERKLKADYPVSASPAPSNKAALP